MSEKILVCGGAGYIGSHMVRLLVGHGFDVVVLDDLSTGHAEALGNVELFEADIRDCSALDVLFTKHCETAGGSSRACSRQCACG